MGVRLPSGKEREVTSAIRLLLDNVEPESLEILGATLVRQSRSARGLSTANEPDTSPTPKPRAKHGTGRPGWTKTRTAALRRAHRKCEDCGEARALNVHHVVPRCKGGEDVLANLRVLCPTCHVLAHAGLRNRRD